MWHSAAGPASVRDRVVVVVGTVAALVLGGCKSSTAPNCSASTARPALWVANLGDPMNTIVGYTANQLASSTSAAPAVVLTTGGNAGTGFPGLAFDASGNLWVAYNAAVVEYTACQLTASGNPKPNVTLTANAAASSLNNPVALAFDARGNLWVADDQGGTPGGNTLVEFTPSQLAASGSPTPAVTLSAINNPVGLAFDHSGNLWTRISGATFGTLVEFSASQLTASGSPIPAVTLSDNGSGSLSGVSGLAFDGGAICGSRTGSMAHR